MAKAKKSTSGGPHKKHGPKRHQFSCYPKAVRIALAKSGLLSKYTDEESWRLACFDRGCKNASHESWRVFCALPSREAQDKWFADLRAKNSK